MAEPVSGALCGACLVAGRTLSPLVRADHQQYYSHILSEISGIPAEVEWRVCWECALEVRRSVAFRERAKCSYVLLHGHYDKAVSAHDAELAREPRLRVHTAESVDVAPAATSDANARAAADDEDACGEEREAFEVQMLEEAYSVKCEVEAEPAWLARGSGATSVKKEEEELSDADDKSCLFPSDDSDDLGRLELAVKAYIRGDTKRRKRKRRGRADKENSDRGAKVVKSIKVKKKKQEAVVSRRSKKCEEKIRTVELSYEEMLAERARDATRDAYTRADFKCASCLVGFSYRKSYAEHVDTRHDQKRGDYSCPICKTVMASVESFTAHYKRHLRRYECGACGKRTMDRKVMTQHYQSTHETGASKEYKCHCGKISHTLDAHRYHRDTHKARVECVECDKTFSHRAGLMNHRLSVHKLNNMFPCTLCEKVFRWKASLKKHLERHERKCAFRYAQFRPPPDAPFCEPCGVSFSSVCTYQRHMKNSLKHVTENELKFICDHCNRKFSNKTKLRDHIEEKHLHKTYQCHICSKPSKNRVCLDQHIRNVHKGRPNNKMCHHCGKGFPTKVQLESHIRSHTGERPFICEFCPTTFSQQSNLYKHNRQVHLNIKAKRYPPLCRRRKEKPPAPPPPPQQHPHPPPQQHHTAHRPSDMYHLVM